MADPATLRAQMVDAQLAARGIEDARVLQAFRDVPRERFVSPELREAAYEDGPLSIGHGQTISQPWVVAATVAALSLTGAERVLEVGTGSGYAAAVLGRLARTVDSIERLAPLAEEAQARLAALGYANVHVHVGDGSLGLPELAPFDAIAVAAASPEVPQALRSQLAIGGRLVIPVGREEPSQSLVRVTREGPNLYREEPIAKVRFVPLIGEQGWCPH